MPWWLTFYYPVSGLPPPPHASWQKEQSVCPFYLRVFMECAMFLCLISKEPGSFVISSRANAAFIPLPFTFTLYLNTAVIICKALKEVIEISVSSVWVRVSVESSNRRMSSHLCSTFATINVAAFSSQVWIRWNLGAKEHFVLKKICAAVAFCHCSQSRDSRHKSTHFTTQIPGAQLA